MGETVCISRSVRLVNSIKVIQLLNMRNANALDPGFSKADARNLPKVREEMIEAYLISTFVRPELRNVKTVRSGRASYGDAAIGYVQVKRENGIIHVKASITPENRVRAKGYSVNCLVNDAEDEVLKAFCEDCAACLGGCKHATAFLFWLYRRTLEPPSTSTENWWLKSRLSRVGTTLKTIRATDMRPMKKVKLSEDQKAVFFNQYAAKLAESNHDVTLKKHLNVRTSLSIHNLISCFLSYKVPPSGSNFLKFCSQYMNDEACKFVWEETKNQATSPLWYDMRYARVTASTVSALSSCATPDGVLVNTILGAQKFFETKAMKRGRELEPEVIQYLSDKLKRPIQKVGLALLKNQPIFGASPDGIVGDHVVEVKCPESAKQFPSYFNKDLTAPSKKYAAQIMLEMVMCKKSKGIFCVANPDFEVVKSPKIIEVHLDVSFITTIMNNAQKFWLDTIFPRLTNQL